MRSLIALNWVKNCTHYGKKIKIKSELEHAYCLHAGIYDQPTDGSVFQESWGYYPHLKWMNIWKGTICNQVFIQKLKKNISKKIELDVIYILAHKLSQIHVPIALVILSSADLIALLFLCALCAWRFRLGLLRYINPHSSWRIIQICHE